MLFRISSIVATVGIVCASITTKSVAAFIAPNTVSGARSVGTSASVNHVGTSRLFHAPAPKHDVSAGNPMANLTPDQAQRVQAFMEHQDSAPKVGFATDVRSLIQYNHGYAVMGTNSKSLPGFPGGSVVGFAPDEEGRPLFVFSGMSSHTQDILADPKCSLTIAAKEFKGAADGRVNLIGTCERLKDPELIKKTKAIYLEKHPGAFWVEFGDFFFYRMTVQAVRFVGGFARAGSVSPEEYVEATPDPIMAFGAAIAQHMNDDHSGSTIAMVEHYVPGLGVNADGSEPTTRYIQKAEITSVDSLGMFVKITRDPENNDQLPMQPLQFKLRLPFPSQVTERGDVKKAIVEMTRASSALKKTKA
jgi:putative heme iron utilization protein